jgi:outer membrane protein
MTSTKRLATRASLLALLSAAAFCSAAATDEPAAAAASADGDFKNTVRLGMYFVHYSASAQDLSGPFTPPGINLRVESLHTPYAAYLRSLTPHWTLEIAAGVPPTSHSIGVGPAYVGSVPFNGQEVATVKWFSPSLLFDYSFFDPHDKFRPYLGAGVNYTKFYDRVSTAAGDAANGGPTAVSLSDSFGPAATAGLNYHITDRISVMGSFSLARVKSDYRSNTAGIIRTTTVDFHPTTWVVAAGYSF